MKRYILSIFLLVTAQISFSQEAMINDIIACTSLGRNSNLIKQIKKEKDTINYYHDGELAIYFNHKKNKELKANTFYIINHGFNKSLIIRIVLMELEGVDHENRKDTFLTAPGDYTFGIYEDSLRRSSTMNATVNLSSSSYKKITIKAIQVEIKYYGISIYRWFLKEGAPTVPVLTTSVAPSNMRQKLPLRVAAGSLRDITYYDHASKPFIL